MASDSQLRSARLPSQKQVIELLDGEFARAGYEIEDVVIDTGTRPPRITVIADGDQALDLDSIAALSRSASELLDSVDAPHSGAPYVLEVTSPGVDRPLTAEKHYRRARGRKVELTLSDGSQLTGRLGETSDGTVRLVVREGGRVQLLRSRTTPRWYRQSRCAGGVFTSEPTGDGAGRPNG